MNQEIKRIVNKMEEITTVEVVGFVEIQGLPTCRCCLASSEEVMDNIFDCTFDDIPLQDILSNVAPVSMFADDGEFNFDPS